MNELHARRVLDFQSIRRVPLAAVLERYDLLSQLKRIGSQHFGACPIHSGTNKKQFVCDLNTNLWRCFGDCDRGGSTIDLVAALEGVDARTAAERISEWFAIPSSETTLHRNKKRSSAMSTGSKPTHKVYSARKREGEKDFLTFIGSGWPFEFKDKKTGATRTGMNIQLSAMPIGDRLVIFEADADEEEQEDQGKKPNGKKK